MNDRTFHPVRLPMYDWPEVREATAQLENALQSALINALGLDPSDLTPWPEDIDVHRIWDRPGALLTQTCGYPLTHALRDSVRPLGVPHYAAEGCDGPSYCSQLVVLKDSPFNTVEDLRGNRAAYNGTDSQSGMNAFRHIIAGCAEGGAFFSEVRLTGSHLGSLKAVAEGAADIASIDAVCWALACREVPDLARKLRTIGQTESAPGLPMITSLKWSSSDADIMVETIRSVLSDPGTVRFRDRLLISGFSPIKLDDYDPILRMEREVEELGYPTLN